MNYPHPLSTRSKYLHSTLTLKESILIGNNELSPPHWCIVVNTINSTIAFSGSETDCIRYMQLHETIETLRLFREA